MASPGSSRAGLGWVVLAAALAVPGVLYYNWSSRMKADRERSVAAKARSRLAEGSVFQTPPAGARPAAGVAGSTAAAPGAAPMGAAPRPLAGAMPVSAPMGGAPAAAAPLATPPGAAPLQNQAPAQAPAAQPGVAVSTGFSSPALAPIAASTAAAIVLSRDPMMSPMDLVRQREAELEAERNAEAIRRAAEERNRPRAARKRVEPKPETKIDLQGIVGGGDSATMAIVNGNTVNVGESVAIEGLSGKVKVVRITASEVIFEYKGKKFRKNVNAE